MRSIELPVDPETRERLETECDLLGFEDVATYVEWIVSNRAAIDRGTDRDQLLSAYAERVEELERQLDAGGGSDAPATEARAEATRGTEAPTGGNGGDADPETPGETATADGGTDATAPRGRRHGDLFVSGSFGERVGRISEDEVNEVVDELTGVETERVDAFARRAVAKTRERLGRDPETGLTYRSSTDLQVPGTRPGSDLADLDAIDVPGRSSDVRARRREAVGAALAYLRDEGNARRSDFVAALFEDHPAGYGTADGWWACIKQGLQQASAVDPAGEGSRTWVYDG